MYPFLKAHTMHSLLAHLVLVGLFQFYDLCVNSVIWATLGESDVGWAYTFLKGCMYEEFFSALKIT